MVEDRVTKFVEGKESKLPGWAKILLDLREEVKREKTSVEKQGKTVGESRGR